MGVNEGSAYDLFLSRTLTHAQVVRGADGFDVYADVVASASATSLKASAFVDSSVMKLAMRSASVKSLAARSGSVGATAFAMLHCAAAFLNLTAVAAPQEPDRDGVGDVFGAVGVGWCHRLRDIAKRRCPPGLAGQRVGDAFGAVGVGGCHRLPDVEQRRCLPVPDSDGVGDASGIGEEAVTRTALSWTGPELETAAVPGDASTCSTAAIRRPASEPKLSWRIRSACRRARPARVSGRSSGAGITAPSTRIGITRTPRVRAAWISSRTQSCGSSSRRLPARRPRSASSGR